MGKGVLNSIQVLEFTHWLSAPYCGNILSDLGANVIKIEPPSGDQVRTTGSYFDKGESYLYIAYNHGKKGISVNLKSKGGLEAVRKLIMESDVIIENYRPGVMEKLGLGYEQVKEINPRIIYLSVSAFGEEGKYKDRPGMDPIIQGMGAVMSMTANDKHSPPILPGVPIADNTTAFVGFGAIAAALYEREISGEGQKIEINLIDMMVLNLSTRFGQYIATGENPIPMGNQHSQVVPYQAFPTADGWIMAGAQADHAWEPFCRAVGREDLLIEKYDTNHKRVNCREELTAALNKTFKQRTTDEWCEIFERCNVLHGPVWGIHELVNSEIVKEHGVIVNTEHPLLGTIPVIKAPIKFSRSEVKVQSSSNLLGEHSREILQSLGYSEEEIDKMISEGVVRSYDRLTI
ncbi:MAG TPA: CoA transferase [Bacillus sp. (in: firmicutes)]|uniref:CaiB/BaiF CoA transferase family protein n=1 Tax=Bacillus litorisediminis TaxID=2922713 RepID=UPI001FAC8B57|nr:CoA transferase [Bacillus litorisediminis]HWO74701.1 CoA transferase [Bacillus sp. (in: firmicutes)]